MVSSKPEPPSAIPAELVTLLDDASTETLRHIAEYAEALAEYQERESTRADTDGDEESTDDLPEDVPSRASVTIKEINDNRYYYWQWRDGDKIRSKYKAPVNPDK